MQGLGFRGTSLLQSLIIRESYYLGSILGVTLVNPHMGVSENRANLLGGEGGGGSL